jgi:hypothetical protein
VTERWTLAASRPLAFGGWEFVITGPDCEKRLEWWPTDRHLSHQGRPFLSAPVLSDKGKAARAAAESLVAFLNDEQEAA